jgi:hypothetical protein
LGKDAAVMAYNLTDKKVIRKSDRFRSKTCSFESNILKFGNDEIVLKNILPFEVVVNSTIIGETYFKFKREELLG